MRDRKTFLFTLNQDLFLERHYYNAIQRPILPGISGSGDWFQGNFSRRELKKTDYRVLAAGDVLRELDDHLVGGGKIFYVKLHGSQNWLDSEGTRRMVIGRDKKSRIQREPLLSRYFDIFKEVLLQKECRLLVIGYGFRDTHINDVLADAIQNAGLEVYVLSPEPPDQFLERMRTCPKGEEICQSGLAGYFPLSLLQVFPWSDERTQAERRITELFFCDNR